MMHGLMKDEALKIQWEEAEKQTNIYSTPKTYFSNCCIAMKLI